MSLRLCAGCGRRVVQDSAPAINTLMHAQKQSREREKRSNRGNFYGVYTLLCCRLICFLRPLQPPCALFFFFVSLLSYFSLWWFSLHFHARFDRFVAVVSIIFVRVFLGGGGDFPPSCCQLFYYRVPGMHCCFYSCYTVSQDHRQLLHLPGTLFACLLVFLFFCLFFFVIARRR